MRSSYLASVDEIEFNTGEIHSSWGSNWVKYNIYKLSRAKVSDGVRSG